MDARGIQPGTAIITLLKRAEVQTPPTDTTIWYRDFWGLAKNKRAELVASLPTGVGNTSTPYSYVRATRESR
jgi:hypothetical protein